MIMFGIYIPVSLCSFVCRLQYRRSSVLEVRALVATLCIIGDRSQLHATRILLLWDSAACVFGASKGRSSKPGMCRARWLEQPSAPSGFSQDHAS